MKILYFDCFSGISGDMVIGALLDAGADAEVLVQELKKLALDDEYELSWKKVNKKGITSTKFDVLLTDAHLQHEKNQTPADLHTEDEATRKHEDVEHSLLKQEYSRNQNEDKNHQAYDHTHHHAHHDHHAHHREHHHAHHDHQHAHHRTFQHIVDLIQTADLSDNVKTIAVNIFTKIAEAEGRIHGLPIEDVHFHEVGAVDSIIDIVGVAILIDQLKIDRIVSSPIPVGSGKIQIDHGIYPVPAPATLEILRGVPLAASDLTAELTTPTGAAIASVLSDEFGTMPAMAVDVIGYGAGTKDFSNHPNVLRVVIGHK